MATLTCDICGFTGRGIMLNSVQPLCINCFDELGAIHELFHPLSETISEEKHARLMAYAFSEYVKSQELEAQGFQWDNELKTWVSPSQFVTLSIQDETETKDQD